MIDKPTFYEIRTVTYVQLSMIGDTSSQKNNVK